MQRGSGRGGAQGREERDAETRRERLLSRTINSTIIIMSVVSRALIHIHKPAPVDDHPVAAPRETEVGRTNYGGLIDPTFRGAGGAD